MTVRYQFSSETMARRFAVVLDQALGGAISHWSGGVGSQGVSARIELDVQDIAAWCEVSSPTDRASRVYRVAGVLYDRSASWSDDWSPARDEAESRWDVAYARGARG
jgi:hypothetical protein